MTRKSQSVTLMACVALLARVPCPAAEVVWLETPDRRIRLTMEGGRPVDRQDQFRPERSRPSAGDLEAKRQHDEGLHAYRAGRLHQARRTWETSAAASCAAAAMALAGLHRRGEGVPASDAEDLRWTRKAAELGLPEAQLAMGERHDRGDGVPRDRQESNRWYALAARGRETSAMLLLGDAYHYGRGGPRCSTVAELWYIEALAAGHERASRTLTVLRARDEERFAKLTGVEDITLDP